MLLPILYNHRLLRRLDRNPEFVIEVQRMPEKMTTSRFKEFVKDPINGQVYKIASENTYTNDAPEDEYWIWLDGYGHGAPAKYNAIPRSLYHDISITPPFSGRASDIDLAILLYGFSVEGVSEEFGGVREGGLGSFSNTFNQENLPLALEYLANDMGYASLLLDTYPDPDQEIIFNDEAYWVKTYKKGNRKAILLGSESIGGMVVLLGDYDVVMETTAELMPDTIDIKLFIQGNSDILVNNFEGALPLDDAKQIMNLASGTQPELTKKEEALISEAEKEIADSKKDPLEKFLDDKEENLDKAVKKGKKEQVETREKEFTNPKDVCKDELKDAITDAAYSDVDTFVEQDIHSEVTDETLDKAQKAKNQILSSPTQITIPADATYQYSLRETSEMYNQPIDREEMEAYFYAHPELEHVRKEVIGDYIHKQDELMEIGVLLYNPLKDALAYRYEYLNGNIYDLIEEFKDNKQHVVDVYKEEGYEMQLKQMEEVKPTPQSISSTDVSLVPFIHPLTEQIVSYTMIATQTQMFTPKKPGETDPGEVVEPLKLSILVFFMDWVNKQDSRLHEFGLTYIEEIDKLYFKATSHKRFAEWFEGKSLPVKVELVESQYVERKDSAKRMVNTLFQEFLKDQLEDDDKIAIDYIFNKNFNGYVQPNTEKLPIFIRHSKYFKNFKKFQLSSIQIKSIKFSTLNNSAILAHEVGYGKTLASLGFISHMFETNQASNIFTIIPKTLYENNKWKEEAVGKTDDQGNPIFDKASKGYVIGGFPMYNLIGVGNLSSKLVYNRGKGGLKEYTKKEIKDINTYQKLKEVLLKPSAQPNSFITPPREWKKILDKLESIDKKLYQKFYDEEMDIRLELFIKFAKKPTQQRTNPRQLDNLIDKFIQLKFTGYWEIMNPGIPFKPSVHIDHGAQFNKFRIDELSAIKKSIDKKIWKKAREKQKQAGKKVKGVLGKKLTQRRATQHQIRMGFLEEWLSVIHEYVNDLAAKMRGYSIYQYGKFTFKQGEKNIILATREALDSVGFSIDNIENVQQTINLVTTYLNEGKVIGKDEIEGEVEIELDWEDESEAKARRRAAEKTLSAQLQQMLDKVLSTMTEAGSKGKFELEQLNIDGFVLDEAHMAKKLFTQVKTDSSVQVINERGKITRVRYSSHDIQGGSPPAKAMKVFGITAYIHSLAGDKPVMFLTATPFTNHPTEIFSMLAMVGMKQLQEHGLSNIKNFFDMFIKETLKYDFNHKGEYVKKVVIEDFRNKAKLGELIWSIMDIRRGGGDSPEDAEMRDLKPKKSVIPRFNSASLQSDEDNPEDVSTIILNRATPITSSIIDRNSHQIEMLDNIEKWLNNEVTEKDICPKFELFAELEEQTRKEKEELLKELGEDLDDEFVIGDVEEDDEMTKKITGRTGFGKTFKALGMARSICLSPYFYQCNDLPYPTPENFVKYSPKIEYVIKCIKSVKDWHIRKGEDGEISGQVIYTNMLNFKYTYKDDTGVIRKDTLNLAKLIRTYMVDEGIFDEDEIDIIASGVTGGKRNGKKRNREVQIKDFQQGRTKVLIGSPAIREGVDLQHNASVLYILTPDWNPTDMRQVEGRIWRRDNRFAEIRVVYALMDNSIEVFIYAKLEEKARRLEKVMKEPNAVEELEEMSLDPKLTKVALVSDPEKRADVIVKEEELETKSKLYVLYRDQLMITTVDTKMDIMEETVTNTKPLYMRYQKGWEDITNEFADWKLKEVKEWKVANPQKLIEKYGGSFGSIHYPFATMEEKNRELEKMWGEREAARRDEAAYYGGLPYAPLTIKDALTELERRRVDWKKAKKEILEPQEKRLFKDDQKPLSTNVDDLEKEIAGMLVEERKQINHDELLEAYNTALRQIDEQRYEASSEIVFDSYPLDKQAKEIVSMAWHIHKLSSGMRKLAPDIQAQIKEGSLPYPSLYSIIPLLGAKASPKGMMEIIDNIDETLSRFRIINKSYLRPRGMTIDAIPTLVKEVSNEIGEKEQIIDDLEQKRLDLIDKFQHLQAGRKDYEVDDLVRAFDKTNVALEHRFPIKD